MRSGIWDRRTGKQIGWVDNGRDVYNLTTEHKFATLGENGSLYSLDGEFLGLHLENLHSERADLVPDGNDTEAIARFRKLAGEN
jgi:hypothetical protein